MTNVKLRRKVNVFFMIVRNQDLGLLIDQLIEVLSQTNQVLVLASQNHWLPWLTIPAILPVAIVHSQSKLLQKWASNENRTCSIDCIAQDMSPLVPCKDRQHQAVVRDFLLRVAVLESLVTAVHLDRLHGVVQVHEIEQVLTQCHIGSQERSSTSVLHSHIRKEFRSE